MPFEGTVGILSAEKRKYLRAYSIKVARHMQSGPDGLSIYVIGSPDRSCYAATNTIWEKSDTRFREKIEKEAVTGPMSFG